MFIADNRNPVTRKDFKSLQTVTVFVCIFTFIIMLCVLFFTIKLVELLNALDSLNRMF